MKLYDFWQLWYQVIAHFIILIRFLETVPNSEFIIFSFTSYSSSSLFIANKIFSAEHNRLTIMCIFCQGKMLSSS